MSSSTPSKPKSSTPSKPKSSTPSKPTPVTLTLRQKAEVLKEQEKGLSCRKIAVKFGVGKTQIGEIFKRKREILDALENNAAPDAKRLKTNQHYEEINKLTYEFYLDAVRRRVEVSGPMLQEIALKFARDLGQTSFTASKGWLDCLKKRHSIVYGKLSGESGDVDATVVTNWKDMLGTLVDGYDPKDIFNQDETALFYKTTQDKSFYTKGEKPGGAKKSKERVTVSMCTNMNGDTEMITLIGKSRRPRCFKNIDVASLPVHYRWNKKGWMTNDLFNCFLKDLNEKMKKKGRQILLFVDNAPSHKQLQLSNVSLRFLPPKTTSVLQPLDQGVIQSFKLQYRKRQYRHIMMEMERTNKTGPEIMANVDILKAIMWTADAWKSVLPSTITKCFKKAGFEFLQAEENQSREREAEEEETPLRQFNNLAQEMTGVDFNNLPSIEENVLTEEQNQYDWSQPAQAILEQMKNDDEDEDEEDETEDPEKTNEEKEPTVAEALAAQSILKQFFTSKGMLAELTIVENLDKSLFVAARMSTVQKKLDCFFKQS